MPKLPFDLYSSLNQKILDALIAGVSFWAAYQIRFEGHLPISASAQMWTLLPAVMASQVLANMALRTYCMIWRYVSLHDAMTLARNYTLLPAIMAVLRYGSPSFWPLAKIPLSIIAMEYLLSLIAALCARATRRILYDGITARALKGQYATPVLLVGAGRTGARAANEIRSQMDLYPVAFLDDDPHKTGSVISGLRVLGPTSMLDHVIQQRAVRQVIVCIGKPPRQMLRRIWATCELLGLPVKIVPSLQTILHGQVNVASLRDVEMRDLLGRSPIEGSLAGEDLRAIYGSRRILVTGAGGSIGSELALQLSKLGPAHLILLDKDENGLNDAYVNLGNQIRATPVVADLRFPDRLHNVFETFNPEIVFHAAAHKHVHLMEINPCEAIANNVTGTRNLVEQSVAMGVVRFVQISTDKAVNPTSIMGASKRVCEMIVQSHGFAEGTQFCCVRFGNVLGSRGSVVPIFKQQILRGGPVTLTHPDAQRFLMTIPEAVCLLVQAGTLAHTHEIFVLDMGEPVLIRTLAQDLIELSGLSPTRDMRIEITGMKSGEKLSEVLVDDSRETIQPTRLHKIHSITAPMFDTGQFVQRLRELEYAAWNGDADAVRQNLTGLGIGFRQGVPKPLGPQELSIPLAPQSEVSIPVRFRTGARASG